MAGFTVSGWTLEDNVGRDFRLVSGVFVVNASRKWISSPTTMLDNLSDEHILHEADFSYDYFCVIQLHLLTSWCKCFKIWKDVWIFFG